MYYFLRPTAEPLPLTMNVLVFKTDIDSRERLAGIKPLLENIGRICRWNVDMHDCDNVLRIESLGLSPRAVESVLREAGYSCTELPD